MTKINEKAEEIKKYLSELEDILPDKFEQYKSNNLVKAGCERYFEKIVEGITDIAFMIIKLKKFNIPEDDIDSFRILKDNKILKEELFKKLKQAKGMRNFIAHQYGDIDDKKVFNAVSNELIVDTNNFIKEVKKCLK